MLMTSGPLRGQQCRSGGLTHPIITTNGPRLSVLRAVCLLSIITRTVIIISIMIIMTRQRRRTCIYIYIYVSLSLYLSLSLSLSLYP